MPRTVFISSTYHDLAPHRRAVWGVLEEFDVNVRGMEEFGARPEAPLDTCLAEVEQSDIYIGIIGFRLGSVESRSGKSFTQLEYERARDLSKEILIYLIDDQNALVPVRYIDRGFNWEKLEVFKKLLRERHTVDTFVSENDLAEKLRRDFSRLLEPKIRLETVSSTEYEQSSSLIRKFFLIPKAISGREVRLRVKIRGDPYPASRQICDCFNFEFGATIGLRVQILNPSGFEDSDLNELYFPAKQSDTFMPVSIDEVRDIYAKLQFIDTYIEHTAARFQKVVVRKKFMSILNLQNALGPLLDEERIVYEPDAKIVMALTKEVMDQGSLETESNSS
jgi:hypothetical protein